MLDRKGKYHTDIARLEGHSGHMAETHRKGELLQDEYGHIVLQQALVDRKESAGHMEDAVHKEAAGHKLGSPELIE